MENRRQKKRKKDGLATTRSKGSKTKAFLQATHSYWLAAGQTTETGRRKEGSGGAQRRTPPRALTPSYDAAETP